MYLSYYDCYLFICGKNKRIKWENRWKHRGRLGNRVEADREESKVNRTVASSSKTFAQSAQLKLQERFGSNVERGFGLWHLITALKKWKGSSFQIGKWVIKIYSSRSHVQIRFRSSDYNSIIQKNEIFGPVEIYIHTHTNIYYLGMSYFFLKGKFCRACSPRRARTCTHEAVLQQLARVRVNSTFWVVADKDLLTYIFFCTHDQWILQGCSLAHLNNMLGWPDN